jgi:hypothetical protein
MLGNPVGADRAELIRADLTFLREDDHQQRDNARDQRDRRDDPAHSERSLKVGRRYAQDAFLVRLPAVVEFLMLASRRR